MKISKLYVGIVSSVALLLLGGCDTAMNTPPQTEISNANTSNGTGIIDTHSTIFERLSAKLTENGGTLNGKVDIVGAHSTPALYFEMKEDVDIEVDYSLVQYKGNLKIAYISPDESETILIDTSLLDNETTDDTIALSLKKGTGRIEFFGDNTNYEFNFNFIGINPDNVSYFDIVSNPNK